MNLAIFGRGAQPLTVSLIPGFAETANISSLDPNAGLNRLDYRRYGSFWKLPILRSLRSRFLERVIGVLTRLPYSRFSSRLVDRCLIAIEGGQP
jgi:hypothetical protein